MRVLLVGPIESIHVSRWHDYLVRRGHIVHIFSGAARVPDSVASDHADRLRFPGLTKSLRYSLGAAQLRTVIRRIHPDVVHLQSLGSNALLAPAVPRGLLAVSPWGGDIVGAMRNPVRRMLVRNALGRAALVLTTSHAMSALATDEFGARGRVLRVSWGVDPDLFTPSSTDARTRARRSFGLPADGLLVTAIRTSAPVYRTLEVIRAFARALEALPHAHLAVVAGFEPNDPRARAEQRRYREELRREVAAARGSAITFIDGPLAATEYAALLRASDVAVSVPRTDQRSSSVLEALASGTTVVLSDIAPCRELIADGYHARIVTDPIEIELIRWLRQPDLLDRREVAENVSLIARTESRPEQFRKMETALAGVTGRHDGGGVDDGRADLRAG